MNNHAKKRYATHLHVVALAVTLSLIVLISCDAIANVHHSHMNLRLQLGLCMILLADTVLIYTINRHINRISGMFKAYIFLLIAVVYFSSLIFYAEEHAGNPDVTTYGDAIWWAIMCMTTAGSYIGETTLTGKILSVVLSGGGLILFPVFTVYITNAVTHRARS